MIFILMFQLFIIDAHINLSYNIKNMMEDMILKKSEKEYL